MENFTFIREPRKLIITGDIYDTVLDCLRDNPNIILKD